MTQPLDAAKLTTYYIELRNKIKELDDEHKKKMAPMREALEKLNGMLLNAINATGGDSIAVKGVGTAYKKTKQSATIADPDSFRRHVIGTQNFDLLDWKANVSAVARLVEDTGEPPPGVNFSTFVDVGVRKGNGN